MKVSISLDPLSLVAATVSDSNSLIQEHSTRLHKRTAPVLNQSRSLKPISVWVALARDKVELVRVWADATGLAVVQRGDLLHIAGL